MAGWGGRGGFAARAAAAAPARRTAGALRPAPLARAESGTAAHQQRDAEHDARTGGFCKVIGHPKQRLKPVLQASSARRALGALAWLGAGDKGRAASWGSPAGQGSRSGRRSTGSPYHRAYGTPGRSLACAMKCAQTLRAPLPPVSPVLPLSSRPIQVTASRSLANPANQESRPSLECRSCRRHRSRPTGSGKRPCRCPRAPLPAKA